MEYLPCTAKLNLNVRIVVQKLVRELKHVSNKWLEIGTLLGIPLNKLESFKSQALADGNPISETCLKSVIEVSKSIIIGREGGRVSYYTIVLCRQGDACGFMCKIKHREIFCARYLVHYALRTLVYATKFRLRENLTSEIFYR
jgi:hypothetical protein